METDLLPPEEDQQTRPDDGLEESFARPAIEDFRRNNAGPQVEPKAQAAKKAAGFLKKNKKILIGGGTGLGLLVPIMLFFFWMMLFKNVHIKNLYVTYRWAQFNRGLNKSLKSQLKYAQDTPEAKINGSAEGTVSPTDAPDEIMKKANASELGPEAVDPADSAKIEAEAKKVTSLEQSVEGASEKTLNENGAKRSVTPAEGTGDTPEAKAKNAQEKAKTNAENELSNADESKKLKPPKSLEDPIEEAKKLEAEGTSPREAAKVGAEKFIAGSGAAQAIRTIQGIGVAATFYCIFQDIYETAKDQVNKILLGGAIGTAQTLNKTADCQKSGSCDANQVGAVAERYDNGNQSFTESCGYTRATQSSAPNCKEINPQFAIDRLSSQVGGAGGAGLRVADALLDPPSIGGIDATGEVCGLVMSTPGQVVLTISGLVGLYASGGGWQAAGKAAGQGVLQFAGTAGGKALIAHTIMMYGGSLYKDLDPLDMGNLTDMGNLATASGSCATAWCPEASDAQIAQLDREYRTERIAANSKRSVIEKFFDTQSPDSVASRVVLNAPTTPQAAIGRIKTIFASITNPIQLNLVLGNNSLAITQPQSAYAATDNGASAYGLSGKITVPPNLLADTSQNDLINWGKDKDLSTLESKYSKCAGEKSESYDTKVGSDDKTCFWDNLDSEGKMFFQYKYAQNVAYKTAIAHNKQTSISGSVGGAVGGTASADNPKRNIDTSDSGKYPCPAGTTRSVQPATAGASADAQVFNVGLCDIGGMTVNASAAQAFLDMKNAAAADGIKLSGGGYRSNAEQISLRGQHGCGGANLYNRNCEGVPPTAVPGRSMHEVGLAVDFNMTGGVFQWLKANAGRFGIFNLPSEAWHWSTTGG